jgi:WD40 repeat protein/serine/threonine protein kinase
MTSDTQNFEGQTIKGYELRKKIGEGGFGQVYLAYQPLLKREVAVKVILERYVNNPEFIRRFEAEAQLISHLEHMHIVPLYDFWREPSGAFLVMRYLRGGSLRDLLKKGHWPIHDAARVVMQLGSALALAHRNGVIHRDVKPDNILLDEERNVYLVDFGIAKDLQQISDYAAEFALAEQQMDGFIGSPNYISPEQIMNKDVGPHTDIYNLGLVIYELVTGKMPFQGFPLSTIVSKHLMESLPHIHEDRPELPEEINHVILKATEKNPANRYVDAIELAAEFRKAIAMTTPELLSELDHRTLLAFEFERATALPDVITDGLEPENPYKGLRAFQESDADDFFGRERLIDKLLHRFREDNLSGQFLALIGPSGSGKSSIMKAGLVPKLRQGVVAGSDTWFIVEMIPGAYPMEELEAALLRIAINPPASLLQQMNEDERGVARAIKRILPAEGGEVLLVIDQFEEIFTQVEDEQARRHFLSAIAAAVKDTNCRLRVLLTLRADFYDRPLLYPEFGQLISEQSVTVLPLSTEELTRAIVEPAEKNNLLLHHDLIARIVADVGEQPGALPLLQYALTELFERRDHRRLTLQAYQDIGGVTGALARRADELYSAMNETQQAAVRQVFLRLVTLGEGNEDTRRRARLDELLSLQIDDATVQHVLDAYGKYRLLTFDRDPVTRTPTVEIAHEALIRQWKQFRLWLDENREGLRLQRRLSSATTEWKNANYDASFLATGTRLTQFEDWLRQTEIILADAEREYYEASLKERSRQEVLRQEQQVRELQLRQRARNFLYGLIAVMGIATLIGFGLSAFAFNQQTLAEQQREVAEANAASATFAQGEALLQSDNAATQAAIAQINESEARMLAFASGSQLALANNNVDLAILLALRANEGGSTTIDSRRVLAEAAYAPGTRWVMDDQTERIEAVDYSPDGQTVLAAGRDAMIRLLDADTGAVIQSLAGHRDWVWDVNFDATGTRAVSASSDGTVILWDVATGEILHTLTGHDAAVRAAAISADGTKIFSGSEDRTVIVWDATSGDVVSQSTDIGSVILDVDMSPSGFTALSAQVDGSIIWWNLTSLQPIQILTQEQGGHTDEVWAVQYMPDELGFVSASEDGTLLRWSFETQAPISTYTGHNARVTSLDISADGTRIVSGSEDNSIILWDTETTAVLHRFFGHTFLVYSVALSPDARHVLSGSWDATVRLWDTYSGAEIINDRSSHTSTVTSVAFSPDGLKAATASSDESIVVWDMATGQMLHRLAGHTGGTNSVAFNAEGSQLVSGGNDNYVKLWDVASGEVLRQFEGHSDVIRAATFSPDDTQIASGGDDNTLIIWDTESGEQIRRLFGHTFHITDVDFSPDGSQIASSGLDNLVLLWDVRTGEVQQQLEGHSDWVFSVEFSPDGATLLSSSADNSLILWATEGGIRLRQYEGHSALVYDAHYHPTEPIAFSASADGSIILWDLANGQILQRFAGQGDAVYAAAMSPDGTQLLSGSANSGVSLWAIRLDYESLAAWIAENRFVRELTCAERNLYDIAPVCPTPTPFSIPSREL